jgi:nicotinate-nucleotide--dimethylbenzimidazole phosphoribosyltransferase
MKLETIIDQIKPIDKRYYEMAQARLDNLTKPQGSLGRLEEIVRCLVGITQSKDPDISRKVIFVCAGDHGVAQEGVSAYPQEVTLQMVRNFLSGGAAINALAGHAGAEVVVVDLGVNHNFGDIKGLLSKKVVYGTKNMTQGPAMTRTQAQRSIMAGIEVGLNYADKGKNVFAVGDMGIGNTTPSSAIASVITKKSVSEVTGKGTGISERAFNKKIQIIEKALKVNQPDPSDPLDILAKVGGAEIGGIAGIVLAGALRRIPVIIDGLISTAGALIAYCLAHNVREYIFASHKSTEMGQRAMLEMMQLEPLLDLKMRLGEGTGAALSMTFLDAALKVYREMATFEDAHVSRDINVQQTGTVSS